VRPLELSPEDFRRLGERVVDEAAALLDSLDERPVVPDTSGSRVADAFDLPCLEQGVGDAALDDLSAIAEGARAGNGRLFPYVAAPGEPVGALGDLYASVLNQNVTAWRSSPAAVTIERTVVRWLAEAVGCPEHAGSLTSGGSSANLMGLAMAREANAPANERGAAPAVVYASDEVHMSVPKAVATLGLGRANLRLLPVDDDFRLRPDALASAIAEDRDAGRTAVAVVATAGTIATGAIDPLEEIAEVAHGNGLWLHVDGAYGGLAALAVPDRLAGLALADSLSLDPHKWLYQALDCSLLLFRDTDVARRTFSYSDDYVRPLETGHEAFAFFDQSLELSRRFRALRLWLSLRYHGLAAFRAAIHEDLRHARLLAELVEAEPSLELLAPVELSAVCFRWTDGGDGATLDARNAEILRRVGRRGRVSISNATIRGAFALRACFVNHLTTDDDVAAIVDEVLAAASVAP
jgi:glutamate/tyrosine decarboxylase-like PLP-dependent enzyme